MRQEQGKARAGQGRAGQGGVRPRAAGGARGARGQRVVGSRALIPTSYTLNLRASGGLREVARRL